VCYVYDDLLARRAANPRAAAIPRSSLRCVLVVTRTTPNQSDRVPVQTSPTELIRSHVAALSPTDRAAFFGLSFVKIPSHILPGTPEYDEYLPLAIFQTNTVSAGDNSAGIFPRMARLNHGCSFTFNAVYSWREDEGVLMVHALKAIKAGEVRS
jgi:hypothetical protein